MIKNFWSRLLSMMQWPPSGFGSIRFALGPMHPKRWWPAILGAAAVFLIATLAFNVGFFILSTRAIQQAAGVGFDMAQVAIDRQQLADVVQLLDGRAAELGRILAKPVPGDPSR